MFRLCLLSSCMFFFFKQKTAYEMRISDWSSDVCSSDLACPSMAGAPNEQIPAIRECEAQAFYVSNAYRRLQTLFDVSIEDQMIGGVRTEVVEPRGGVAPENRRRVLINVHGGAFNGGARSRDAVEALAIAETGRLKVSRGGCRAGTEL